MIQEELKNKDGDIEDSSIIDQAELEYDHKKEKRAKIGWMFFFGTVIVLMAICIVVIANLPV